MAEIFLHLANQERKDIVETLSVRLGRRAKVLEKDVWVCWALFGLLKSSKSNVTNNVNLLCIIKA
jgi:hypothetical protein